MPSRLYVETTPSGDRQFVLKRSHSHHHHHRHHHHRDHHHRYHDDTDIIEIPCDEMNNLRDRERWYREAYENAVRENHALKANWSTCDAELRRLQTFVPQLQHKVRELEHENRELRRSLDGCSGECAEKLRDARSKNQKLKAETEAYRQTIVVLKDQVKRACDERVTSLLDKVRRLEDDVLRWVRRDEDAQHRLSRMRASLDVANAKNEQLEVDNEDLQRRVHTYERILRRHRLM